MRARYKLTHLLAAVAALAIAGSAPRIGAEDYEEPVGLRASKILPAELLRGPHHRVDEKVKTDGFRHIYTLHTDTGRIEGFGFVDGDVTNHGLIELFGDTELIGELVNELTGHVLVRN